MDAVPVGVFVCPVISAVSERDLNLLPAEAGEINLNIPPCDFTGVMADVGLQFGLSVDGDSKLPVALFVGSDGDNKANFLSGWEENLGGEDSGLAA